MMEERKRKRNIIDDRIFAQFSHPKTDTQLIPKYEDNVLLQKPLSEKGVLELVVQKNEEQA